jgi:hypothetical protein
VFSDGRRVELPASFAAHVWDAVRRGITNDPKEYVEQLLDRALAGSQDRAPVVGGEQESKDQSDVDNRPCEEQENQ